MGPKATKESVPAVVARSWLFNAEAEECGRRLSWGGAALCVLLAALSAAFPFSLARYRDARSMAEASRWPGLGAALLETAARGGDFRVADGIFLPDPAAPMELEAGGWRILLDGGAVWDRVPPGRVLRFGGARVTLSDPDTKSLLDAPESVLEGVTGKDLRVLALDRSSFTVFVKGFLSSAASAEAPGAILSSSLLMVVQTSLFVAVLGGFLALSGLSIGGGAVRGPRAAGVAASLRVVAALSPGAGLVAAVVGSVISGPGLGLAWLVFALLLGLRVVLVYMGRFARRKASTLAN